MLAQLAAKAPTQKVVRGSSSSHKKFFGKNGVRCALRAAHALAPFLALAPPAYLAAREH
jgi:hypothetical protein